ncbi:MAG: aldo/keto reductase [Nitrososphaerales archaeon]|nr:aldo/keto reductase [Nitrososphaerales archaeon]
MRRKTFGKTGREASEIGVGTYYDPLWIATAFMGWRRGAAKKVEAIGAGLEAGITLVDTAEAYGSEPLVAEAIRGRKRDKFFVATKAWSNHLRRDALKRSLEKSLKRLGVSYVDLYQVHFPNKRVPISETMAAMEDFVRAGKILHVGVSNFSLQQIQEANAALPKSQLSSVQLPYNLMNRAVEKEILPYCVRERIAFIAYFPLAHGKLVSNQRLAAVCAKYGKTASQLALRWLARKDGVFPIPRASEPGHVAEDAAASGWDLTDEDAMQLERLFS